MGFNMRDMKAYEVERSRYNFLRIWTKRYAHMLARHEGRSTNFSHSNGMGIMTREEFFAWCKQPDNLEVFLILYLEWVSGGFQLSLSPSIDRIYSDKGYVADNIQWMAFAENCEKNHKDPFTHKALTESEPLC